MLKAGEWGQTKAPGCSHPKTQKINGTQGSFVAECNRMKQIAYAQVHDVIHVPELSRCVLGECKRLFVSPQKQVRLAELKMRQRESEFDPIGNCFSSAFDSFLVPYEQSRAFANANGEQ
jgi:hypothetical protein